MLDCLCQKYLAVSSKWRILGLNDAVWARVRCAMSENHGSKQIFRTFPCAQIRCLLRVLRYERVRGEGEHAYECVLHSDPRVGTLMK